MVCSNFLFKMVQATDVTATTSPGADPGGDQHCLGHGQIFGRAKQLFCLLVLVLILVFGCGPTSSDTVGFVGCETVKD